MTLLGLTPESTYEFTIRPPLWLVFMVILPAVIAFVWWVYRREGDTAPGKVKLFLAVLRIAAIIFIFLTFLGPRKITRWKRLVKSQLVVMLDTSESMEFVDRYSDADKVRATKERTRLPDLAGVSRLELMKAALANKDLGILEKLGGEFDLQVYTFDTRKTLFASPGPAGTGEDEDDYDAVLKRIRELGVTGSSTSIGDPVAHVLAKVRNRPLAGIVIVTDGRQNTGTVGALEASRAAAETGDGVPIHVVGVGDPDLPKNIRVSNLRAREVVLRAEEVSFEFTVTHKGFAGMPAVVEMQSVSQEGEFLEELNLRGADVVLGEEDEETPVRVLHRFERPGYYTVKIGIPLEDDELIAGDNYLEHHLRVVDRKIKVLFVDGYPRWEYRYLKNGLTRDNDSLLVHVINQDAARDVVPPYTVAPGWKPRRDFPIRKDELYEYDVVIFGDVDWQRLGKNESEAKEALANLKQFVADGGGFMMIAGPYDSPRSYRNTEIRHILPIVVGREDELVDQDTSRSFNLKLTEAGRKHPIMRLADDSSLVSKVWEKDRFSAQFWYFPVERAKPIATVLAQHPGTYGHNKNKFGPHVLMATMRYKAGQTLYIGVDELWRLRWSFGDRYHYRFYSEAIRQLATGKLLGGNLRFKIFTDRDIYFEGDEARISAEVFDQDFNPSNEETVEIAVTYPNGTEASLILTLDPTDPGNYVAQLPVDYEGTYLLTGPEITGEDGRPEKRFKVEFSTEEMKNPLIDITTMRNMANVSKGRFMPLYQIDDLLGSVQPKSEYVTSGIEPEDLWDKYWVLIVFAALLAIEWMVRKRFRLM